VNKLNAVDVWFLFERFRVQILAWRAAILTEAFPCIPQSLQENIRTLP
jgi:hypothetical protein